VPNWKSFASPFARLRSLSKRKSALRRERRRAFQARFEALEGRALLTAVAGDFNGDGVADLAIGIPSQTVGGASNAGAVQILYGTIRSPFVQSDGTFNIGTTGLTILNKQLITETSLGKGSQASDGFGTALAVGDFNHDGIMDLAIGAPGRTVNGASGAGAVFIIYGSRSGLRATAAQVWMETSINRTAAAGDHFGSALAVGDFDDNHWADLAVGIPNKTAANNANAGAVAIIYGRTGQLRVPGNQLWDQSQLNAGSVAAGDLFGSSLAAGDFNADGFRDLAVGAPGQTVSSNAGAGAVNVIYGRFGGLNAANNQFWTVDGTKIQGNHNANAQFGFALAAGDFNDDSRTDLAIGAPGEDVAVTGSSPVTGAGAVHVLMGSSSRLTATNSQLWDENNTGVTGSSAATGDRFGAAVAAGLMNGDRLSDLAIGAPGATVNSAAGAGRVEVLYGAFATSPTDRTELKTTGSQEWDQHKLTVSGDDSAANEAFGSSLAIGDFNGDRLGDLAVEVPGESNNNSEPGSADAIFGSSNGTGLSAGGTNIAEQFQLWLPLHKAIFPDVVFEAFFGDPTRAANNLKAGQAFLAANKTKPGVITLADGLQYKVISSNPSGDMPTDSNSVSVIYTGSLIDGTVFDDSRDHPDPGTTDQTSFNVTRVVPGFSEALKLMHVGDHIIVYIPANLAYGTQGQYPSVPPNSVLIFDLTLVSIS
jgi:hypothetical protein